MWTRRESNSPQVPCKGTSPALVHASPNSPVNTGDKLPLQFYLKITKNLKLYGNIKVADVGFEPRLKVMSLTSYHCSTSAIYEYQSEEYSLPTAFDPLHPRLTFLLCTTSCRQGYRFSLMFYFNRTHCWTYRIRTDTERTKISCAAITPRSSLALRYTRARSKSGLC